jgi:hypothetical protein
MPPLVRKRRATLGAPTAAPHAPPWREPARLRAPGGGGAHTLPAAASPSGVPSPQSKAARCQGCVVAVQEEGQGAEEGGVEDAARGAAAWGWGKGGRERLRLRRERVAGDELSPPL